MWDVIMHVFGAYLAQAVRCRHVWVVYYIDDPLQAVEVEGIWNDINFFPLYCTVYGAGRPYPRKCRGARQVMML